MGHIVHSRAFEPRNIKTLCFIFGLSWYRFNKKRVRSHYSELLFLHPVGSVGHIGHSDVSGSRNVYALFSCSGGTGAVFTKSASGHVMSNL
jgi:hypothetical protein